MWTQHSYLAEHFWSEQIRHSLLRHCLNWKLHPGRSFIKSILIEVFLGAFAGGGGSLIASIGIPFSFRRLCVFGPFSIPFSGLGSAPFGASLYVGVGVEHRCSEVASHHYVFHSSNRHVFFCKANWIITSTWFHSSHLLIVNGNIIIGIPSSLRCLESLE